VDILYLLIPLSALLVLALLALFGWAVFSGQFENLEHHGQQPLQPDWPALDEDQGTSRSPPE
jgi:cbb3-type cytochrome oxidase maturation protein